MIITENQRQEPEQSWRRKKVMLPILNTKDKEKVMHAAEKLNIDNIQKQRVHYRGKLKADIIQKKFEDMDTNIDFAYLNRVRNKKNFSTVDNRGKYTEVMGLSQE